MAIFLCDGNCDICKEAARCPMKDEVRKKNKKDKADSVLSRFADDYTKKLADKINSKWLVDRIGINLFNFIQYVEIMAENSKDLTVDGIKQEMRLASSDEEFFRVLNRIPNDNDMARKIRSIINELAKKVLQVSKRECPAVECGTCWMKEDCVQIYAD